MSVVGAIMIVGRIYMVILRYNEAMNLSKKFYEYIQPLFADKSEVIPDAVVVESACRGHMRIRHDQP
jgi:hypothetical protein